MTEQLQRSREWLLFNAVEAWLYHYESSGDPNTVAQYKQLQSELHDVYMQTLLKDAGEPSESTAEPTPKTTTSTRKRTRNASQSSAS